MTSQPGQPPHAEAQLTDGQLVEAVARERDVVAFESLLRRYQRPLFGFIRRQVGTTAEAEDVFQQTALRIFDRIDTCRAPDAFRAWAFGVAANVCRTEGRRQQRWAGETAQGSLDDRPGWTASPESQAQTGQVRDRIARALDALPPPQREVFVLYYYTRLSYDEVAQVVGAPVGTVKSRMNAALTQLRTLLAGLEEVAP